MPKRPVVGKVKPGMTIRRRELGEVLRYHKPCNLTWVECEKADNSECLRGSIVVRQTGSCLFGLRRGQTSGAEEPDEGNLQVRICGGCVW